MSFFFLFRICTSIHSTGLGIRSFAHSLFPLLLKKCFSFFSFAQNFSNYKATVSDSLENCSGLSKQKSEVSASLSSLITKERPGAICRHLSFVQSDLSDSIKITSKSHFRSFAHKNERFARRTNERIPNPGI